MPPSAVTSRMSPEIIVAGFFSSFNTRSTESSDTARIFREEIVAADESSKKAPCRNVGRKLIWVWTLRWA